MWCVGCWGLAGEQVGSSWAGNKRQQTSHHFQDLSAWLRVRICTTARGRGGGM
jgi:hypothetical protein